MKLLSHSLVAAVALLTLATPAWAKKKPVDLSEFKGTYTGTLLLTISNQVAYSGTATVVAVVPKSGRSVVLTTTGFLNANNNALPFSTTFSFNRNGQYFAPNLLLGLEGAGIAEIGTYKVVKGALVYNATFTAGSTTGATSGKVAVRTRGRKQTLTFTNLVTIAGQPVLYTITFEVTRKIKKK